MLYLIIISYYICIILPIIKYLHEKRKGYTLFIHTVNEDSIDSIDYLRANYTISYMTSEADLYDLADKVHINVGDVVYSKNFNDYYMYTADCRFVKIHNTNKSKTEGEFTDTTYLLSEIGAFLTLRKTRYTEEIKSIYVY